jgi:hypothetical protein
MVCIYAREIPFSPIIWLEHVDFLRNAGMNVSVLEPIEGKKLLTYTVKLASGAVKTDHAEIIANANILDYETAEALDNKPKRL